MAHRPRYWRDTPPTLWPQSLRNRNRFNNWNMETSYEISPDTKMIEPVYEVVGDANWNSWSKIARLIKHMTWRSLAARYRGSALGFVWTLVNPIMLMFVYTFVFK